VGPCHTALYKGGGGHWLAVRGSPPATHHAPTIPSPIYRERRSDGKHHRRRHFPNRCCPCAELHYASLPLRRSPTWLAVPAAPLPVTVYTSPLSSLSLCSCITSSYRHTVTVCTRVDLHLVDPTIYHSKGIREPEAEVQRPCLEKEDSTVSDT
jgi:hypothetical protein